MNRQTIIILIEKDMKTITVTKKTFDRIKNAGDRAQIWCEICESEYDMIPGLPMLAGGLDHMVVTKKQVEIHDIGCSNGSHIQDSSFRIRIRK
jgi:hypothetical protein